MRVSGLILAVVGLMAGWVEGQGATRPATGPAVGVRREGSAWVIEGERRAVRIGADLKMQVRAGGVTWDFTGPGKEDLAASVGGKGVGLSLREARKAEWREDFNGFERGVRIELSDFEKGGDLGVVLRVALETTTEEVVCEVWAREGGAVVKRCLWPGGVEGAQAEQTVVPYMQGMLLPRDWPKKVFLYDSISYGRGLYMPWWGHLKGGAGMMVILETAADGGCQFAHPAGGPTMIRPMWVHSLGKLGYARRARMCFLDKAGYVELAKRYRRYVIERGRFVSLKEKIARSPLVGKLIGSPVIHTSILSHIQPESSYYDKKNPEKNHQLVTFDARAEQFRKLGARGVRQAYVHLDGWGFRGYDNLHPDILPPSPGAGGWEGMRRLAETCDELGWIFAVHDNYRDYYHDAASYDPKLTIIEESGGRPFMQVWWGGRQSILCSKFAPGHVAKNHRQILEHGVKLRGAYLDVFAVVPGDECYSPDHPVTRGQSLAYRGECLDLIRALEGVVSSEEPADWAIPHIDLVHHAPFALDPNPGGRGGDGDSDPAVQPRVSRCAGDAVVLEHGGMGNPDEGFGLPARDAERGGAVPVDNAGGGGAGAGAEDDGVAPAGGDDGDGGA